MKEKRSNWIDLVLVFTMLAGAALLLYPAFSDYWNSLHQSRAIVNYAENVAQMDQEEYQHIWSEAWAYNHSLLDRETGFALEPEQQEQYETLLNISGQGVMGYIEIPSIGCTLPIYHGTDEAVLQVAVGHLDWSSLPVGGDSSHCVLSGHRGLPSAKLFTHLDKLREGDTFLLRVLDEVLTYEVDQISIVEPHQTSQLKIAEGQDLCTLVTCTPYGINTHRLLVRGHRIQTREEGKRVLVTADAMQIEPLLVAPVVAAPALLVLMLLALLPKPRKRR